MANGDDKKIKGSSSGYTYTITDPDYQSGFRSSDFQDEQDLGGGSYSVTGTKDQTTRKAISGGTPGEDWNNWMIGELNRGVSPEMLAKQGHGYADAIRKKFPNQYKAKKTTYTHNKKQANNVVNTNNNNSNNGNTGNVGGGSNIATATGGNATIGNINVGGNGTKTSNQTSNQTQQKKTLQPNLRNKSNSPTSGTTSTTSSNRGYTGNTPFNQATATGGNASIGNITINAGGSGSGGATPEPAKPNITGQNNPGGGGAKGLLGDIMGGGSSLGVRKTQGGDPNQPGGPAARRGGSTPYQMRGLQNQFQSWAMNHYNNTNNVT